MEQSKNDLGRVNGLEAFLTLFGYLKLFGINVPFKSERF